MIRPHQVWPLRDVRIPSTVIYTFCPSPSVTGRGWREAPGEGFSKRVPEQSDKINDLMY